MSHEPQNSCSAFNFHLPGRGRTFTTAPFVLFITEQSCDLYGYRLFKYFSILDFKVEQSKNRDSDRGPHCAKLYSVTWPIYHKAMDMCYENLLNYSDLSIS